jgi:hypothetical protein
MKSRIKDTSKINLHNSTLSTELYATNSLNKNSENQTGELLVTKLNVLKSKTAKILNFYYEIIVNKNC